MLSHGNFMFEADTLVNCWESVFQAGPGEQPSTLLFLPLAHVFGRMVEVAAVRARVKLGHQPVLAAAELLPDLAAFRPTFVLGVPYVFEKVFAAARRKAELEGRTGGLRPGGGDGRAVRRGAGAEGVRYRAGALGGVADGAPAVREAGVREGPRGDGRPGAARDVGRVRDGAPARAVLRRRGDHGVRGVRADGVLRGGDGESPGGRRSTARSGGRSRAARCT
ncbi:hypothetical protein GCM10020254_20500 [Streptomyces goshikiensis]